MSKTKRDLEKQMFNFDFVENHVKNQYFEQDYEFDFYKRYLDKYADLITTVENDGIIELDSDDQETFSNLKNLYSTSSSVSAENRNSDEKLADSLMFFMAAGTIVLLKGRFFINLSKLQIHASKYSDLKDSMGISYSKGAK